jgi:hypothetical protein
VGKVRGLPHSGAPERCFTRVGPCLPGTNTLAYYEKLVTCKVKLVTCKFTCATCKLTLKACKWRLLTYKLILVSCKITLVTCKLTFLYLQINTSDL